MPTSPARTSLWRRSFASSDPRREIFVADDDGRSAGRHVLEPAPLPAVDCCSVRWCHLRCSARPSFNQLALKIAVVTAEHPIAPLSVDDKIPSGEGLLRTISRVRAERRTESFVGPLMPVDQLAHEFVVRIARRAKNPAIVAQREEGRRARRST